MEHDHSSHNADHYSVVGGIRMLVEAPSRPMLQRPCRGGFQTFG